MPGLPLAAEALRDLLRLLNRAPHEHRSVERHHQLDTRWQIGANGWQLRVYGFRDRNHVRFRLPHYADEHRVLAVEARYRPLVFRTRR